MLQFNNFVIRTTTSYEFNFLTIYSFSSSLQYILCFSLAFYFLQSLIERCNGFVSDRLSHGGSSLTHDMNTHFVRKRKLTILLYAQSPPILLHINISRSHKGNFSKENIVFVGEMIERKRGFSDFPVLFEKE